MPWGPPLNLPSRRRVPGGILLMLVTSGPSSSRHWPLLQHAWAWADHPRGQHRIHPLALDGDPVLILEVSAFMGLLAPDRFIVSVQLVGTLLARGGRWHSGRCGPPLSLPSRERPRRSPRPSETSRALTPEAVTQDPSSRKGDKPPLAKPRFWSARDLLSRSRPF